MTNSTIIKDEFMSMLKVLESIPGIDISNLLQAVGTMDSYGPDKVSYHFNLMFWQITPPDNTLPSIRNLDIKLEMVVNENLNNEYEPLDNGYVMQLYLSSMMDGKNYLCSWHLDLDEGQEIDHRYIHPRFHLTFGGKSMRDFYKDGSSAFGKLLLPVTPRIPCAPMDGILAIDFILNHFFKRDVIAEVLVNSQYRAAVKSSQRRIWKPYYESFHRFFVQDETTGYGVKYIPNLI